MTTIANLNINLGMGVAGLVEGADKATRVAENMSFSLERQIATFGMSREEAKLYGLAQRGASEEVLNSVRALQSHLNALKANADQQAKMASEAAALADATRSPNERLAVDLARLQDLYKANAINAQTYARAVMQAEDRAGVHAEAVAMLRQAKQVYESTITPIERYEKDIADLDKLLQAGAIDQQTYNRAVANAQAVVEKNVQLTERSRAAIEAQERALAKGAQVFEATRTPTERYHAKVTELNDLLKRGAIDQQTHARAMKQANSEYNSTALSLSGLTAALGPVGVAAGIVVGLLLAAGTAAAAAAVQIAQMTMQGVEQVSALKDQADTLGVATDALAGLRQAADDNGSSAAYLDTALEKMNQNLADAAIQGGPAALALQRLGLNAAMLASQGPEQAFRQIADAMAGVTNPAERAGLAVDIFGKSGQKIIPLLRQGSSALDDGAAAAHLYGTAINAVDAAKVDAAGDAMKNVGKLFTGAGEQLAVKFAPLLEDVSNRIINFVGYLGGVPAIVNRGFEAVGAVLGVVADAVQYLDIHTSMLNAGWTIGLAAVAKGVSWVGMALEALVNMLPGVDVKFSGTLQRISAEADKTAAAVANSFKQKLSAESWSKQIGKFVADIQRGASDKANANALNNAPVPIDTNGKAIDDIIAKLESQKAALGRSAAAQDVLKLAEMGATAQTIAHAMALADQIDKFNQQKQVKDTIASLEERLARANLDSAAAYDLQKAAEAGATQEQLDHISAIYDQLDAIDNLKKMQQDANQVFEQTRTPLEKYQAELDKLGGLLDQGLIDWDTYGRAVWNAQEALDKAQNGESSAANTSLKAREIRFSSAMPVGNREPDADRAAKQTAKNTGDMAKNTGDLVNLVRDRLDFEVVDDFS